MSKNTLLKLMLESLLLMIFSRSFMASGLMFKSLNHFKFTFVPGVRD